MEIAAYLALILIVLLGRVTVNHGAKPLSGSSSTQPLGAEGPVPTRDGATIVRRLAPASVTRAKYRTTGREAETGVRSPGALRRLTAAYDRCRT